MNDMILNMPFFANEGGNNDTGSSTEKLTEALKGIVKSPVFYIVIGAIVLLIIAFYVIRRFVKASPNVVKVVVRGNMIHKLIDDKEPKYFLVPFKDRLGAIISLDEKQLSSDKLFINNGPDALYKVNFTLTYKVTDVTEFYPYRENIVNIIVDKMSDELREYADNGHALDIVKDYRKNSDKILSLINKAINEYAVEALAYKVNYIEPTGKR